MIEITPKELTSVIRVSLLSRSVIFTLQLLSNWLLDDHNAGAYRNRYLKGLEQTFDELPWIYRTTYATLEGLSKWDAQYFLEISHDGYTREQHIAFMPLFPTLISTFRRIIFNDRVNSSSLSLVDVTHPFEFDMRRYVQSITIGVILNNIVLFPIASISLFSLTKVLRRGDVSYAKEVVWWFCFNPASIFFSACYSESLFAAITFFSLYLIESKSLKYREKEDSNDYQPLQCLNRLSYICLTSTILLAFSTATRSNGLIAIGFICYQFILKYIPLVFQERLGWTIKYYILTVFELLQDLLFVLMSGLIIASGYVLFQIYSYLEFCNTDRIQLRGKLANIPVWCDSPFPHPYQHVQAKYWDVGPFRYYKTKQLPNFLLALPMATLVLCGCLTKSRELAKLFNRKELLPYYIEAVALVIFSGITINVQVITRLVASTCPALYWICTDISRTSHLKRKYLKLYFFTYLTLGSILHSNFYPWT